MEVSTPEYGLIIWTFLSLVSLVFSVVALISLLKNKELSRRESLGWIIAVWFIPIIGSILYFNTVRNKRRHFNSYE